MNRIETTQIYKIKKSEEGFIVSFRLGTDHGIGPGMLLKVLNEDNIIVGKVAVLFSTDDESEALVTEGSGVKLCCRISVPSDIKEK
jgi:hypothetical protein